MPKAATGCDTDGQSEEEGLLQWHLSNIEYSTTADINELSLRQYNHNLHYIQEVTHTPHRFWDQDDATSFDGSHCMIREGYSALIESLATKVEAIRTNFQVW